jgi:uncharacterized protein YecE (DUF72 family)
MTLPERTEANTGRIHDGNGPSRPGAKLRHAVEVRHESFACAEFVALCRKHETAIIFAADSEFPLIPDITADFVYARLMGTAEKEKLGYPKAVLQKWAEHAKHWAAGQSPTKLALLAKPAAKKKRDVFMFVISGAKAKNPGATMALISALE